MAKKRVKTIAQLSDASLEHYSYVATDSFLLMEALFDQNDIEGEVEKEKMIDFAKELYEERKKGKVKKMRKYGVK